MNTTSLATGRLAALHRGIASLVATYEYFEPKLTRQKGDLHVENLGNYESLMGLFLSRTEHWGIVSKLALQISDLAVIHAGEHGGNLGESLPGDKCGIFYRAVQEIWGKIQTPYQCYLATAKQLAIQLDFEFGKPKGRPIFGFRKGFEIVARFDNKHDDATGPLEVLRTAPFVSELLDLIDDGGAEAEIEALLSAFVGGGFSSFFTGGSGFTVHRPPPGHGEE